MEVKWKVKVVMSDRLVLNGVYTAKDNDSPRAVAEKLLGVSLPKCEQMYGVILNEGETGFLCYRLPDVSAVEIAPFEN